MKQPKIAIVCDFLTTMGGAENVVLAMHEVFPDAPIYTALYNADKTLAFAKLDVRTSKLQKIPKMLRRYHKLFPTFAVKAMRQLDLSNYDIILTSSYLHGHQVTKTRPNQKIICYMHTPPRYYWSHYDQYRRDPGYGKLNPLVRLLMPIMIPRQRKLDLEAVKNIDVLIANSTETQTRIKRYYDRKSTIIHPPVETNRFTPSRERSDYYVTLGRQLPYKRYDLVVKACQQAGVKLKVFGDGPMHSKLQSIKTSSTELLRDRFSDASDEAVAQALENARGFIYPAEEDFGIVTVEALAAGAPVIALDRGGSKDIVSSQEVGILIQEQSVEAIVSAIHQLESSTYFPSKLQRTAKRFDKSLFKTKLKKVVLDQTN